MSFIIFSNKGDKKHLLIGVEKDRRNHLLEVNEIITRKTESTPSLPKTQYASNICTFQDHSIFTTKKSET